METSINTNDNIPSYNVLVDLRKRYEKEQKDYLNLCYSYLNFYTGLILSILGVTVAGIVQINPGHTRYLVILTGPLVSVFLAFLGYANVKVFFRRFIEAWITLRNIEEMLDDKYDKMKLTVKRPPLFTSKYGGFTARFERIKIEKIIEDAHAKGQYAEDVVDRITNAGDTLFFAKLTFFLFIAVSILLVFVIWLSFYNS